MCASHGPAVFDILFDCLSLDFVKRHLFGICPIRDQMSLTLAFLNIPLLYTPALLLAGVHS